MTRRRLVLLSSLVAGIGMAAGACTGQGPAPGPSSASGTGKPTSIYAGPAGLSAGAQPQPDGFMWLLARTAQAANLQELNLATGTIGVIIPESASATSIAQSSSGVVGVGLGTSSTGALELRNGSSGALITTVAIGAPVKAVFASTDGSSFYVLNATRSSSSVTAVDASTQRAGVTIPVPLGTVSVAIDPSNQNLFALGPDGAVSEIAIGTGSIEASFQVGAGAQQLAVSPSGALLYVLKADGAASNVGVVDVQTESQRRAVGAPADTVGLQVSLDGRSLYDVVGTAGYGNVQVFPSGA